MPLPEAVAAASPAAAGWLVASIAWPVIALLLVIAGGERFAARVGVLALPVGLAIAAAVALGIADAGELVYHVGGWAPPLGIALRADWLSAAMLLVTAVVAGGAGIYALADFGPPRAGAPGRTTLAFWASLLGAWAALNLAFLGNDLFNLYVALELLTSRRCRWCASTAAPRRSRPRCAISCSRWPARCCTCSARCCSTAPTARSTWACSRRPQGPGPPPGPPPR
jgi:hypothetical protein